MQTFPFDGCCNREVPSALHGTRVGRSWTPTYKDITHDTHIAPGSLVLFSKDRISSYRFSVVFQAVFSASILDHMIHQDKKFAAEYSSAENCLEMQVCGPPGLIKGGHA